MKNEADFKKVFVKSIRRQKGFAQSLSAPMISGIPDLYTIFPGYMPILLEAKWLGEIKNKNFSRKIPYSALQLDWLKETNKIQPHSSFGIIGFKYCDIIYCVMTDHNTTQINYGFKHMWPYCIYSDKEFIVTELFAASPIPMMNIQPLKLLTRHFNIAKVGTSEANIIGKS